VASGLPMQGRQDDKIGADAEGIVYDKPYDDNTIPMMLMTTLLVLMLLVFLMVTFASSSSSIY
jgi:hypothetical protein